MSDPEVAIKIIFGIIGVWMLYDLTFGFSSPRAKRQRDQRWAASIEQMRRDKNK